MSDIKGLFDFIRRSPTAYHATEAVRQRLLGEGYVELYESDSWELREGGKYFVTRGGSSLIAFREVSSPKGFMIAAAHTDSPAFRVKLSGEKKGVYSRLDVEKYGGMIYYSWLDRPLSVAGRVVVKTEGGAEVRLVNIDRDLVSIPSLAIHLNRTVNDGAALNPARDMLPMYSLGEADLATTVAESASVKKEDILSHDLFLYCRDEGRVFGERDEFILCPRLDDLESVYAATEGFLKADESQSMPVLAIFDNEEVGSETKQGAASTFLRDTLSRAVASEEGYLRAIASGMMLSIDNAHAFHPNRPEMSDPQNAPVLGGGIVVKFNASQRYATDGISHGIFVALCEREGIRHQRYYNRADLPGGSTLGSISDTRVSVPTVDIGFPQLAMHSANETAAVSDLDEMISATRAFFSASISAKGNSFEF